MITWGAERKGKEVACKRATISSTARTKAFERFAESSEDYNLHRHARATSRKLAGVPDSAIVSHVHLTRNVQPFKNES